MWAMKNTPGWLGYIGIIINQYYKDLYQPTSTMESRSFFSVAHVN